MADHEIPPLDGETGGFEKKVHQKMVDMELIPSDTVWEKVDERLHPQGKRRLWLIWIMLLLAGLGLGGYIFWNSASSTENNKTSLATRNKTRNSEKEKLLARPDNTKTVKTSAPGQLRKGSVEQHLQTEKENNVATVYDKKLTAGAGNVPRSDKTQDTRITKQPIKPTTDPIVKTSGKGILPAKKTGKASSEINTEKFLAANRQPVNAQKHESGITLPILNENDPGTKSDPAPTRNLEPAMVTSPLMEDGEINTSLGLAQKYASATRIKIKAKQSHGWSWGLILAAGRSSPSTGGIHSLFQNSAAFDAQSVAPSGNINLPPAPVPSTLKAGPAFKVGMFVKRQLTPRLSVSGGLNYNLFTLSNKVGQKVDSAITLTSSFASDRKAIEEFYKTGTSQNYVSRFHFIELPLLLHAKLASNERMPLSLDLGFSLSKLISSNALHYNSNSGIYYKDNNLFNKTQLNFITGLPIRFISTTKFSLDAGPHVQYGITKLVSDPKTGGKHLFFLGVKAGILFRKK